MLSTIGLFNTVSAVQETLPMWERFLFLLTSAAVISLAVFILARGRRDRIHVTFSIFLFSLVLLNLSIYFVRVVEIESWLRILGKLTFATGGLSYASFLALTEVFPKAREESRVRRKLTVAYAIASLSAVTALSPYLLTGVSEGSEGFRPNLGWGIVPWTILFGWCGAAGFGNLIRSFRELAPSHQKKQVEYVFVALFILAPSTLLLNIVLPTLANVRYVSVTPFLGTITVLIMAYAIVRHRLMNLGVVFRNTTVQLSVILSVAALMICFHFLFSSLLGFPTTLSALLAAGAVAGSFQPLKEKISALTDKYIFKGRYDYRKVVMEFGEKVSRILDLKALEKCVVEKTMETMGAQNGLILIADARFEGYRTEYAVFQGTRIIVDRVLTPGNALLEELKRSKKVIVEQEVRRTRPDKLAGPILEEMARLRSAIVIPLISKDELLGILSLGEKMSGDIYSAEDVSLLIVLANQVASSLENSRLFNEILLVKDHQDKILQHLRSGVITVGQDSKINSVNQRAAQILKRARKDVLRRPVSVLGNRLSRLVAERLQEGFGHFEGELQAEVHGKGIVPLGIVATIMAGERDTREMLLVFDDLSEMKLLQERIRRADRLAVVGTFAAGMAHEIKNPLVPIKTFSQLLPEMFDDSEFRNRFSVLVPKEVERINLIIEKLLNFARPTKPLLGACDMHELIDEVLLLLEGEVKKKSIEVRKGYTRERAVIRVDREQMKQVLLNLFLNAVQAVESDGRIDVSTAYAWDGEDGGDGVFARRKRNGDLKRWRNDRVKGFQIRISDTGCGMSEDDLKHLFDPFFSTKPEGTGLGLAISHAIVEEHNGRLDAESTLGQGATFTVKLPATKEL